MRFTNVRFLLVVLVAYILIRSAYWSCPPIWDGMVYYTSLLEANRGPFDLLKYSADGHLCEGLFLVMSLPFELFHRDYVLFNAWLTLFGTTSLIAFYLLLQFFSHDQADPAELALITALFAFHPSVLASMTHF